MKIASVMLLADTWSMHGDGGAGWWIGMMIVMVLFWGAVILGIVWVARGSLNGWRGRRAETTTDILERRFAEGAMSVEDYEQRRKIIATGHSHEAAENR